MRTAPFISAGSDINSPLPFDFLIIVISVRGLSLSYSTALPSTEATIFGISDGEASCTTTIYGIPGTTTKIVVTQYLEKKNGNSWGEVTHWTDTFENWWCNFTNPYTITESGTYRLRSEAKVYSGTKYENVDITSKEKTVKI